MMQSKLYIFFLFVICGISQGVFAQQETTFQLSGRVMEKTDLAIEGATVLVFNAQHQMVKQSISAADGAFVMALEAGTYSLKITYLGSIVYEKTGIVMQQDVQLNALMAKIDNQILGEVKVLGVKRKPVIEMKGNTLVFNVEKALNTQGSTALEVLKNTPGVVINKETDISLSGLSGTQVMINGKPTFMQAEELGQLLKSTAGSEIKSIELMRSPGAEYAAEGTGGIINIIMKKPNLQGFNMSINNGLAYGETLKQNSNLSFNMRGEKLNVFGAYNHNLGSYAMRYNNDRVTGGKSYLNPTFDLDQRKAFGGNIGLDYEIDTANTIGFLANVNALGGPAYLVPTTYIYDANTGEYLQKLQSRSDYLAQRANRYGSNLNYQYDNHQGLSLKMGLDYTLYDGFMNNRSSNTYFDAAGNYQSDKNFRVETDKKINLLAANADFTSPWGKGKWSAGLRFSNVDARNQFDLYNSENNTEILDVERSNDFHYVERIMAGYAKYEGNFSSKWTYEAGLRAENTHSQGDLQPVAGSTQAANRVDRNYTNIFPSLNINYKSSKAGTYGLSYAYRINRPAYNDLNPFVYPVDELSYWKGNPFLRPQYAHNLGFQYSIHKTTAALNYTHTRQISAGVTEIGDHQLIYMTTQNVGFQNHLGLTLTQQLILAPWWDVTLTGIGFYIANDVKLPQYGNYQTHTFAGTLNAQWNFKLPYKVAMQISSVLNSKTIAALNGISRGNGQVDIGFQKSFFKDNASLNLAFTDIFLSNRYYTTSDFNNFRQVNTFVGESRQIRLNFTFKIGNVKLKPQREKPAGLENENNRL